MYLVLRNPTQPRLQSSPKAFSHSFSDCPSSSNVLEIWMPPAKRRNTNLRKDGWVAGGMRGISHVSFIGGFGEVHKVYGLVIDIIDWTDAGRKNGTGISGMLFLRALTSRFSQGKSCGFSVTLHLRTPKERDECSQKYVALGAAIRLWKS